MFEELDESTRSYMLSEFQSELTSPNPYWSPRLTETGRAVWPQAMRLAIKEGNEETLEESIRSAEYWNRFEPTKRGPRSVPYDAARQLAVAEFATFYVRGLCARLLAEGQSHCQVYRAAPAREPRPECGHLEEHVFPVVLIYDGYRAHYWPEPGNKQILSVPTGPNCHHVVRRYPPREQSD